MKRSKVRQLTLTAGAAFALGVGSFSAGAQSLDSVIQSNEQGNDAARQSQERIDRTVEQTRELAGQYSAVTKEVDGLKVYNQLLERQVENQRKQKEQLTKSMDEVTVVERQVTPLMTRMISTLETFIENDIPFLMDERSERLGDLKELLPRSDVTVAEKFRKVFEAYQIEAEYGRTIEAYKGTVSVGDGEREVDFLRIGRVGLYYQTADQEFTGRWDQSEGAYVELPDSQRSQVRTGLQVARQQVAPDLFTVTVSAPEA